MWYLADALIQSNLQLSRLSKRQSPQQLCVILSWLRQGSNHWPCGSQACIVITTWGHTLSGRSKNSTPTVHNSHNGYTARCGVKSFLILSCIYIFFLLILVGYPLGMCLVSIYTSRNTAMRCGWVKKKCHLATETIPSIFKKVLPNCTHILTYAEMHKIPQQILDHSLRILCKEGWNSWTTLILTVTERMNCFMGALLSSVIFLAFC